MDLHELFDEVATEHEPPTSLSVDRAYRDGRRRSTFRTAFTGTAVAGALIAVVVGATTVLGGPDRSGRPADPPPTVSASADRSGVRWASAWDGDHLYAGVQNCRDALACTGQLLGSDDGGRTWTPRGTSQDPPDPYVVGARTLLGSKSHERDLAVPGGAEQTYALSTDGGRHWSDLTLGGSSVAAVPAGGYLMCMAENGPSCKLYAVDPVHLRAAPLAAQEDGGGIGPQAAGGPLWAVGSLDIGKVAVSLDNGRTWRAAAPDPACPTTLSVWTGGQPGHAGALCVDGSRGLRVHAFRTTDNGATWQAVDMPAQQPFDGPTDQVNAFMLHDGTVVVARYPTDGSMVRLWSLSPGRTSWQAVPTSGLPAYATIVEFDHDGSVLAHGSGLGNFDVYRSSDLRTWTKLDTGA
jgi:photosystem II stability/assembly factor-like uncharacterized protein